MPCFEADRAGLSCKAPHHGYERASSSASLAEDPGPFLTLHHRKTKLYLCTHLNSDRAMVCFRSPVITGLGPHLPWSWGTSGVMHIWTQQQRAMQNVILEALRLNFLFFVKFTSLRTTAVYFLYTSCNFHAHLTRILGSKTSYENCKDWRLLFLFGHQTCM